MPGPKTLLGIFGSPMKAGPSSIQKKFFSGIFNMLVQQILRTLAQISANEENYPPPNVSGATMRNRAVFIESPKMTQRLTISGVSSPRRRGQALRHCLSYVLSLVDDLHEVPLLLLVSLGRGAKPVYLAYHAPALTGQTKPAQTHTSTQSSACPPYSLWESDWELEQQGGRRPSSPVPALRVREGFATKGRLLFALSCLCAQQSPSWVEAPAM